MVCGTDWGKVVEICVAMIAGAFVLIAIFRYT